MSEFMIVYLIAMACNLVIGAYFFREEYIAGKPLTLSHALLYIAFIFAPVVNAAMLGLGIVVTVFCGCAMGLEWLGKKCSSITLIKGRGEQ